MSRSYFNGKDTYLIWGTESGSYGTGTPLIGNKVEKLQDVSYTFNNNTIISQGVGGGADATSANYGNFDVTGSLIVKPTDFHFMNFSSGSVHGAGTAGSPYKIVDADNYGTSGTALRSATFEIGAKGNSNNVVYKIPGCLFNSWTFSGNQGEELQITADFIGQIVKKSSSLKTFSAGTIKTFVFASGSVGWNNEVLDCTAFSVSGDWPTNSPREVFNRFVKQPTKGVRRYRWTLTLNKHFDDASGVISATELMEEMFGSSEQPVSSGTPNGRDLQITIRQGASSGNKVVQTQFEESFITDWAENPSLEGGLVSVTVNGISLSGKEEDGDYTPLKWWVI